VRDNGVGFPPSFSIEATTTLGLSLVQGLVDQLGGSLSMRSDNGAVVEIELPVAHMADDEQNL
jgi:two-component sensor histidine kinase